MTRNRGRSRTDFSLGKKTIAVISKFEEQFFQKRSYESFLTMIKHMKEEKVPLFSIDKDTASFEERNKAMAANILRISQKNPVVALLGMSHLKQISEIIKSKTNPICFAIACDSHELKFINKSSPFFTENNIKLIDLSLKSEEDKMKDIQEIEQIIRDGIKRNSSTYKTKIDFQASAILLKRMTGCEFEAYQHHNLKSVDALFKVTKPENFTLGNKKLPTSIKREFGELGDGNFYLIVRDINQKEVANTILKTYEAMPFADRSRIEKSEISSSRI